MTIEQKIFIQENTIKDSGVICWEEYHSSDNKLVVTNINLSKLPGFYAERIYTIKYDGQKILVSVDWSQIFHKYCELLLKNLL